ncbi:TetR/AcrR family transcriptional regulator [Marinibacterium sp. SX1]|uniref:TetR/AcrR family transcriptional regulator n=1 Tax=Marinibacterium sp. SX1 TaxID=3388424 RepID=UPI003D16A79F
MTKGSTRQPAAAPVKARGRGRPARISRDRIARAALEIGIDKATVTALAGHLGVDHSSLYRHVTGREEIVALAAEIAIEELDWRGKDCAGWREELIALTDAIWDLYERHPGLAEAFRALEVMPQSGIRAFAEAVARLQSQGFSLPDSVLAVDMLIDLAGDCFLGWRALHQTDRRRPAGEDMASIWEDAATTMPESEEQIGGMLAVIRSGPRPWWERKRDLVLDGLAANRAPA